MKDSVTLLDGYSLIYRTYFAFMKNPLLNREGKNVSVVYGFFNSLFAFIKKHQPPRFAVVLDSHAPTFRHEMYKEYKANREKAPDDLHAQIPIVEEVLKKLGIPIFKEAGLEADDIIASFARNCQKEQRVCKIITGDKDLLQLVDPYVSILKPDKGKYREMGEAAVIEEWGVTPNLILDLLSLMGDSADNIPGVAGIGPKTALKMLTAHPSLEEIYENLNELTPALQKKMEAGKENAYLSRSLVRLKDDDPYYAEQIPPLSLDREAASEIFMRENIPSLAIGKIKSTYKNSQGNSDSANLAAGDNLQLGTEGDQGTTTDVSMEIKSVLLDSQWKIAQTIEDVKSLLEKASSSEWIAFDIETDNINDMQATPVGFSLCFDDELAWYIPLKAEDKVIFEIDMIKPILKQFLEENCPKIIGQNFKYDYKVLLRWGIKCPAPAFDTMIAAWLIDSNLNNLGMDFLADRFLNYETIPFKEIVPKGTLFESVELEKAAPYAAEDALITWKLWKKFKPILEKENLLSIFNEMEMPLIPVLAEMEMNGIYLNKELLSFYSKKLGLQLDTLEKEIYQLCGKEFNIKSTKQLQQVLFEDRGLKPTKKTKTGYSTDTTVLQALAPLDPVPKLILRHRTLAKLKSTYTDTLGLLVHPETNRLHTRLIQTGTATGRLSSRDPNLQNIPVKDEEGRMIRRAFQAGEGNIFMSADYSQVELVVLASLADEENLKKAFLSGVDIHRRTASLIFNEDEIDITAAQRRAAKTINFGVMYGMSSFRLSRELSIPMKQASDFIKAYFESYSGIRRFIDNTVEKAQENGFVLTAGGHKRIINGINSRNKTEQQGAQRVAVNTPIQGTAAEIVKRAMLAISKRLSQSSLKAKMILQIHDELLFELPQEEEKELAVLVKEEMEKAANLSIPVKITIESGQSWGDFH